MASEQYDAADLAASAAAEAITATMDHAHRRRRIQRTGDAAVGAAAATAAAGGQQRAVKKAGAAVARTSAQQRDDNHHMVVWQGFLKKKSPKGLIKKVWQTRYFILYTDVLMYFKEEPSNVSQKKKKYDSSINSNNSSNSGGGGTGRPLGTIPLAIITSIVDQFKDAEKAGSKGRFDIHVPAGKATRIFSLIAESAKIQQSVVNALRNLIARAQQQRREAAQSSTATRQVDWASISREQKPWKATEKIKQKRRESEMSRSESSMQRLHRRRSVSANASVGSSVSSKGIVGLVNVDRFRRLTSLAVRRPSLSIVGGGQHRGSGGGVGAMRSACGPAQQQHLGFVIVRHNRGVYRIRRIATKRLYILHTVPPHGRLEGHGSNDCASASLSRRRMALGRAAELAAQVGSLPGVALPIMSGSLCGDGAKGDARCGESIPPSRGVDWCIYAQPAEFSMFDHLRGSMRRLPLPIVRMLAVQLVFTLSALHKLEFSGSRKRRGVPILNLCAERLFVNANARPVIVDPFLCVEAQDIPLKDRALEYLTLEELDMTRCSGNEDENNGPNEKVEQLGTEARDALPSACRDDWWRLGVLLYELIVGFPPFRVRRSVIDEDKDRSDEQVLNAHVEDLYRQLQEYATGKARLRFPPFVESNLQLFITSLLCAADPCSVCSDEDTEELIKNHSFFRDISWDFDRFWSGEGLCVPIPADVDAWMEEHVMPAYATSATSPRHRIEAVEHVYLRLLVQSVRSIKDKIESASDLFVAVSCGNGDAAIRTLLRAANRVDLVSTATAAVAQTKSGEDQRDHSIVFDITDKDPFSDDDVEVKLYLGSPEHGSDVLLDELLGAVRIPLASLRDVRIQKGWFSAIDNAGVTFAELQLAFETARYDFGATEEERRVRFAAMYGNATHQFVSLLTCTAAHGSDIIVSDDEADNDCDVAEAAVAAVASFVEHEEEEDEETLVIE